MTSYRDALPILIITKFIKQNQLMSYRKSTLINPYVTNGLSHPYHLDESVFVFRGSGSIFLFLFHFFDENDVSKQNSPRWDAAFCGVTSGAILCVYVPQKGRSMLIWVKLNMQN